MSKTDVSVETVSSNTVVINSLGNRSIAGFSAADAMLVARRFAVGLLLHAYVYHNEYILNGANKINGGTVLNRNLQGEPMR